MQQLELGDISIEIEKKNPDLKLMYGFNHRYHDSNYAILK